MGSLATWHGLFVPFVYCERLLITDAASYGAKSITGFKARKISFLRM